jgi:hypothetical protein
MKLQSRYDAYIDDIVTTFVIDCTTAATAAANAIQRTFIPTVTASTLRLHLNSHVQRQQQQ